MLEQRKTLPVYNFKEQILQTSRENQVIIIRGATGCGKTTQVPQYVLDDFIMSSLGNDCNIVVTQVNNGFDIIYHCSLIQRILLLIAPPLLRKAPLFTICHYHINAPSD